MQSTFYHYSCPVTITQLVKYFDKNFDVFQSLTLTDDTVLEEHNEDPALIQMHLIGDGGKYLLPLYCTLLAHLLVLFCDMCLTFSCVSSEVEDLEETN